MDTPKVEEEALAARLATKSSSLDRPPPEIVDLLSDGNDTDDGGREEGQKHEHGHGHDGDASVNGHESAEVSDEGAWETDSLYEDAFEGMGDEQLAHGVDGFCTLEEAMAFRTQLREVGEHQFIANTIEAGTVSAKKLCTAFGIRPPAFLDGAPDSAYYPFVGLGISRELSKRAKLAAYNTVDDVVELLKTSRNIVVLTGAGISTSLGIPDFRSKETGLYSRLAHLGLSDPQEVFDIDIFRQDPSIFYSIAADILPTTKRVSPTHAFIALLQQKQKLLTNFTQNIDNLETLAGVSPEKLIQCHGSFATATCVKCRHQVPGSDIYDDLKAGRVARCKQCLRLLQVARAATANGNGSGKKKRKRSPNGAQADRKRRSHDWTADDDDEPDDSPELQAGVMKPDITFFGEDLPSSFHTRLVQHDRDLVDLVLVIGTSLKVAPVSEIVGFLPPTVPQVYISRTPVSHVNFDVDMLGDCDVVVAELCRRAGWPLEHEMVKSEQKAVVERIEGFQSRWAFKLADD
ncbi:MAG: hypothetical protein M1819_000173 [Sarea resinae]|nr:MAG: hypothetical protein M1819_000173 [Sarea resinae]